MSLPTNPALEAFVAEIGNELVVAQVMIRRRAAGFELRHVDDRELPPETLRGRTSQASTLIKQPDVAEKAWD